MKHGMYFWLTIVLIALSGCAPQNTQPSGTMISEVYQTERNEIHNIDSPAVWHGNNGEHWLLATSKERHKLVISNAEDGVFIQFAGSIGHKPGKFKRPNGIFVIDNYVIIVERDNQRVQIIQLPGFEHVGFVGEGLKNPYGLWVRKTGKDMYSLYVTDNYETEDEGIPADSLLGERVHHYQVAIKAGVVSASLLNTFGATSGAGVLSIVESIWGDPVYNRLLIAEEDETQSSVKVYDMDGNFTGTVFGLGKFEHQVEGIALYETSADSGYWIITDQSHTDNEFHVFERQSLQPIGSFYGPKTTNTDGIWLSAEPFGPFEKGAFFAVHNDGNVSAFDWKTVVDSLGLD